MILLTLDLILLGPAGLGAGIWLGWLMFRCDHQDTPARHRQGAEPYPRPPLPAAMLERLATTGELATLGGPDCAPYPRAESDSYAIRL